MPLVITPLEVGGRITGRLVSGGWTDRLRGRRFVLIEATDARLHYAATGSRLEIAAAPMEARPRKLVVGDLVTLTRGEYIEDGRRVVKTRLQPVALMRPVDGISFSGRLVGYARGNDKRRYALLDVGREVWGAPAGNADIAVGREVRARCGREDNDWRKPLVWQLADEERERQRQRGRGREL